MIDQNKRPGKLDHVVLVENEDGTETTFRDSVGNRFTQQVAWSIHDHLMRTGGYKSVGVFVRGTK